MAGTKYCLIFVGPQENFLSISDVTTEIHYIYGKNDTTGKFRLSSPGLGSKLLVWINESYYSLFLICVYSKSLTITFLANMAKALVFSLICEFAVIYCIHMTPLPKITARFEKYGHFYIVCIIFHVLLGWSHKSILACQILHRTHCAMAYGQNVSCTT